MDDIAKEIHMDPLEFRKKNLIHGYYEDAYLKPIAANTNGIFECLEKGAEYIHWDEKRKEYVDQTGDIRRGVGVSVFSYKTGVWPISLEIAGCRLSLNQDGSVQMQIGATAVSYTHLTAPAIAGAYYKYDGQYRTSLPLVNTPYERKKKGE